jgi:hypothetical protein
VIGPTGNFDTFSNSEISNLTSFVNGGGRLVFTVDTDYAYCNSDPTRCALEVTRNFGFAYGGDLQEGALIPATGQSGHPIWNMPNQISSFTDWCCDGYVPIILDPTNVKIIGVTSGLDATGGFVSNGSAIVLNENSAFNGGKVLGTGYNMLVGLTGDFRMLDNEISFMLGKTLSGPAIPHASDDPPPSRIKPSFGGIGNMIFTDGLTINGKVYDLDNFSVNIPKNLAGIGQPVTIKVKEELAYGPQDWDHVAIYMNFEGKDPETYNAHLILSDDKNNGPKIDDPKGYIKDFSVTTKLDSQYVYTTFSFTAAKAMSYTSVIVSAWDAHKRVNNVYVGGAIQFGEDPVVKPYHLPDWLHKYTNSHDINIAVENVGYQKPLISSHIANSDQVWKGSDGGSLKWLFDSANKTVSFVIYDNSGNVVLEKTESLKKIDAIYSKCTDNRNCMYSWNSQGQLSRTDSVKLEKVEKAEQDRIFATLRNMGYFEYFDHTPMQ